MLYILPILKYELEKEKYHRSNGKILRIGTCIQTNIRLKQYRLERENIDHYQSLTTIRPLIMPTQTRKEKPHYQLSLK